MFAEIELLPPEGLAYILDTYENAPFVDGRETNPNNKEKHNLQLKQNTWQSSMIAEYAIEALMNHRDVRRFAFPKHIHRPMMTKYTEGMYYGLHCDAPFMVGQKTIRSDISCTIFLTEPETYDGGELRIHLGNGQVDFKLKAGSAILYPSTTLHEVLPVTRGERLAVITFIESNIADQYHRDIMYNLNKIKETESLNVSWENRTRLNYVFASLERMWSNRNG